MIEGNKTEENIVLALEEVCYIVPAQERENCLHFIDTYGTLIVHFIIEDFASEFICRAIGVCVIEDGKHARLSDSKCEVCELALQYLESMLDNNETTSEIEFLVSKICKLLPEHKKMACLNIVKEFGPMIVHYIATHAPPQKVCTLLNLCHTPNKSVYVKCIAGPSYWCASKENAIFCQAEEHCKKFVWA